MLQILKNNCKIFKGVSLLNALVGFPLTCTYPLQIVAYPTWLNCICERNKQIYFSTLIALKNNKFPSYFYPQLHITLHTLKRPLTNYSI